MVSAHDNPVALGLEISCVMLDVILYESSDKIITMIVALWK